jgi:hypothetical protein
MLSQTSRQEILRKINSKIGYPIKEENLTPATRQAITNLAVVQRHLFVITELLRGEKSRIERSFILSTASKLGKDSGRTERTAFADEISKLQAEIDNKISEVSQQILAEENARQLGQPLPQYSGKLEVVQLKCPSCGASLPIPTGRVLQCQYCKNAFTIQEVSSQVMSMIRSI